MAIVVPVPISAPTASVHAVAAPPPAMLDEWLAARQAVAEVAVAIELVRNGMARRMQLVNVAATPASIVAARALALAGGVRLDVRPGPAEPAPAEADPSGDGPAGQSSAPEGSAPEGSAAAGANGLAFVTFIVEPAR